MKLEKKLEKERKKEWYLLHERRKTKEGREAKGGRHKGRREGGIEGGREGGREGGMQYVHIHWR